MLNGGSMVWGFCVYFVYMIPLETDVLRKHRFQKHKHEIASTYLYMTSRLGVKYALKSIND